MESTKMRKITLGVSSLNQTQQRLAAAFRGKASGEHLSFTSEELLCKVLSAKRLGILKAMAGQGAMSVRQIAGLVDRDVKAVHGDLRILLSAGVIERTTGRGIVFLYDSVRVDFTFQKIGVNSCR
jgi:predicted transcriptional regulator